MNELDQDEVQSADVIGQASTAEKAMSKKVGKAFAQKYALAESAGISVAKTLQDWATIGRDRARTSQDVADFSKRLYGVKLDTALTAINNAARGEKADLENLKR